MDTTQLLLTIVLSLSSFLLIIIGVQLIFVLRELRKTLHNVNKIVDGFENMGTGLQHGLGEVTGFMNGFKTLLRVIEFVSKNKK